MTIVFVHGVPETAAIWDPLVERLGRDDVIRLSPPGFGAPVPDDFEPNRANYVAWLAGELEAIAASTDAPIDLVGHDWGAGHTAGVMATRPELVRSWAMDVAGIVHPEYVWHDMAQLWRTPDVGEETVGAMMGATDPEKMMLFESLGMTRPVAAQVAPANDATMGRCILGLYRSADPEDLATVWETLPGAAIRPGLIFLATEDTYVGAPRLTHETAARAGATVATLDGLGHWWMMEGPDAAATELETFWATLD